MRAANDFRLLRVIGVMKPNRNTPVMYPSRVSIGSMTAVAVVVCVASLTPALASQNGGFANPSMLQNSCCLAAQTQALLDPESGFPIAGAIFDRRRASRTDAAHAVSRSWHAPESDIQQAPSFTASRPLLTVGDRWITGQTRSETGIPGRFVTGLTAGDAQVLAYAGSGETGGRLAQAPAVNQQPRNGYCESGECAESRGGSGDFAVSGTYGPAARAISSSDSGSAIAQAAQQGTDQSASGQAPAEGTKEATVDPAAPEDDSTTPAEEFSGSAAPAGPDLTVNEEQSAISQGWK